MRDQEELRFPTLRESGIGFCASHQPPSAGPHQRARQGLCGSGGDFARSSWKKWMVLPLIGTRSKRAVVGVDVVIQTLDVSSTSTRYAPVRCPVVGTVGRAIVQSRLLRRMIHSCASLSA